MFDNDSAGEVDTEKVNDLLPDIKVNQVKYDTAYKDPDEYFKNNPSPRSIQELMSDAVPMKNEKYVESITNNILEYKNRNFSLSYRITHRDGTGKQRGDFTYYYNGTPITVKTDIAIDKIGKDYLTFILPMNQSIENHYDCNIESKSFTELLDIFWLSRSKSLILEQLAVIVSYENDITSRDKLLVTIRTRLGDKGYNEVLKEINSFTNSNLDPERSYPFMPASQAYDIQKGLAYMYFNLVSTDEDGIKMVPALLSSDKRILRLDQFRRKSNQHLLIVDASFQLHEEVQTAIMNTEICSLKSKYAKMFIDNAISAEVVKPRAILQEMISLLKKVFYTEDELLYTIIALFAYSTYFYQLFGVTPYLFLNSQKGSGKSLLASVLSKLCFCCRYTVGTTEAALFRTISSCGGTIILDEMESLTSRDKTTDSLMASILKSGYSKNTGNTLRTNLETKSIEEFSLYGPKIILNIFGLEDVIEDRCLKIPMKKYPASVTNKKMNLQVFENNYSDQLEKISSEACISALINFKEIYDEYVSIELDMGSARNSQIMRPIITLASIAGQEFEDAVHEYYRKCMLKDKDWMDENSPEGLLKKAFEIVEEEAGKLKSDWIDDYCLRNFIIQLGTEITVNTFVIKLLMDQIDGQKLYSMADVHKLIKRVYPDLDFGSRTSIGIASNENWVRLMGNKTKISVYNVTLTKSEPVNDNLAEVF